MATAYPERKRIKSSDDERYDLNKLVMSMLREAEAGRATPAQAWTGDAAGDSSAIGNQTMRTLDADDTLAILLPLLILLSTLLCLLLLFLVFLLFVRRRRGIVLPEDEGPLDLGREEDLDGEGGFNGVEQRWLESADEASKTGYIRAKNWQAQYPPNSQPTDITLSQFLSIQEKGVAAWSFEPDYESNPPLIVQSRTEIVFLADGVGMAPEEGGGACVQSNLPLPRLNEVYYWECKMYEKPESTNVSVGLATKPFPSFRLPGLSRYSVGYFTSDGFKSHNFPFTAQSYGPPLIEGDVIGVGYRPRTGAIFFTRNGKKLDEAYVGFTRHNVFPTVGANGAAVVHVNLGQAGFVFIEANVKKWGLAPSTGTLAPPPAYGLERGSILLATAAQQLGSAEPSTPRRRRADLHDPTIPSAPSPLRGWGRRSRTTSQRTQSTNGDSSSAEGVEANGEGEEGSGDDDMPHNPPTPNLLDIGLRSLSLRRLEEENESLSSTDAGPSNALHEALQEERRKAEERAEREARRKRRRRREGQPSGYADRPPRTPSPDPPNYAMVDPNVYAPGVAEAMLGDSFAGLSGSVPTTSYEARHMPEGAVGSPMSREDSETSPRVGWRDWLQNWGTARRGQPIALPQNDNDRRV